MAQRLDNPRFPHNCVIYNMEGATSLNPQGYRAEVYSGACRRSGSDNTRTFNAGTNALGKVDTADARVSLPGIIKEIKKGFFVDVVDLAEETTTYRIVSIEYSQLFGGSTAIICKTSSN